MGNLLVVEGRPREEEQPELDLVHDDVLQRVTVTVSDKNCSKVNFKILKIRKYRLYSQVILLTEKPWPDGLALAFKNASLAKVGISTGTENPGVSSWVLLGLGYRLENSNPSKTHTPITGTRVCQI